MTRRPSDRSRTIEQLEGAEWGPPAFDSYLVTMRHQLRSKPIEQCTVEDLRIMIGQGIGLPFLIPLALDILHREPLAQGDYYPGDLLQAALGVDAAFWLKEWEWAEELRIILGRLLHVPKELTEAVAVFQATSGPTRG